MAILLIIFMIVIFVIIIISYLYMSTSEDVSNQNTKQSNQAPSPINCKYTPFGYNGVPDAWSPCDLKTNTKTQTRKIHTYGAYGGQLCSTHASNYKNVTTCSSYYSTSYYSTSYYSTSYYSTSYYSTSYYSTSYFLSDYRHLDIL
jgi:hypothetical protein